MDLALTPELTEIILANTDLRTLLISAQRVCKTWHDIIQKSRSIQRALFFEPIAPNSDKEITQGRTMNPLLAEIFPAFFKTAFQPGRNLAHFQSWPVSYNHGDDPFAFMDTVPPATSAPTSSSHQGARTTTPGEVRDTFLRAGASWRRMLPQQPAAPHVGHMEIRGPSERGFYSAIVKPAPKASGSVTMGMLYDMVYCFMGQKEDRSRFCVYWRDAQADRSADIGEWRRVGEQTILSGFPEDVGVVVIRNASPVAKGEDGSVGSVSLLEKKYRPAEMRLYNPKLICVGVEDWFG